MISVVVPCYNHGRYLLDALASVIGGESSLGWRERQDVDDDVEVVVVDDRSTDETIVVLMGLEVSGYSGVVRSFRLRERSGTPAALNYAIEHARGETVAILHADDMLEPWHLSSLRAELADGAFVYGDLRVMSGGQLGAVMRMSSWSLTRARRRNLASGAIMLRRSDWENVGGYPADFHLGREDWAMTLRLASAGVVGRHVRQGERASYLYRREGQSTKIGSHDPKMIEYFNAMIRAKFPELWQERDEVST